MNDYDEIARNLEAATAPGDIPVGEVVRRFATVQSQFRHENTIVPLAPAPGEDVRVEALAGSALGLTEAEIRYTIDGSLPDDSSARLDMNEEGVSWVPFSEYAGRWVGTIPSQSEGIIVRYRLIGRSADGGEIVAQDGQGFWYRYPPEHSVTRFAYRVSDRLPEPAWLRDAVIYQVFVDRFRRRGGPFLHTEDLQAKHGGDLLGIIDALPYLEDLGVNCLWLSPIGPAPSYHRYDVTDLFSLDSLVGDRENLRQLTSTAHDRGIRVILDFVPSHLSVDHPAFVSARTDPKSDTRNWFVFYEWPDKYRTFLETVPRLVSLNTNDPGVRQHIAESARFWIQCGIDGFRLDHVIGHGMDFWVEFQASLESLKPDVVTVGEATDTGDALLRYRGRISSVLDFPLARALRLTFATGDWDLAMFDGFLSQYDRYMEDGPARVSFLDNHDMDRFLFVAGQDTAALKMATLCFMTLTQTPVIYYGTEIGMTQELSTADREHGGDALARQDMPWDPNAWDRTLLEFFRRAISFRRRHMDLIRGMRKRVHLNAASGLYAYSLSSDAERVAVVFNLGNEAQFVPIDNFDKPLLSTGHDVERRPGGMQIAGRTAAAVAAARILPPG